jgi:RHS repeat-associated protein
VAITDASGNIVQRYSYEAFGQLTASDPTFDNFYTYTGREYDKETGLYYYRARYYDAMEGRFLSKDPIGLLGGINQYNYVGGNPVNYVDPSGLTTWTGKLSSAAAISGVGAGFFYFDLTSECQNNRKVRVKGVVSSVAAGLGMKFTGTNSSVSFRDHNDSPDPYAANGLAFITAAGAAAGGKGYGGLGYSASQMKIGDLFSPRGISPSTGADLSAAAYFGASIVTDFEVQECCEE